MNVQVTTDGVFGITPVSSLKCPRDVIKEMWDSTIHGQMIKSNHRDTGSLNSERMFDKLHDKLLSQFSLLKIIGLYRGADKSLTRPGRKQANVSGRMA